MNKIVPSAVLISLLVLSGCATTEDSSAPSSIEGTNAIYPLGIDLSTVQGNLWFYHDMNPDGKTFGMQIDRIHSGFAEFVTSTNRVPYQGWATFGFEKLGYNNDGDLIGKSGNDEQVLIRADRDNLTYTMQYGTYAGRDVIVSKTDNGFCTVNIDGNKITLQRGIGVTAIDATASQAIGYGQYELEYTMPDPPVHFGE